MGGLWRGFFSGMLGPGGQDHAGGVKVTASAEGQWYYSMGSDAYPSVNNSIGSGVGLGAPITVSSKTITKISVKIGTNTPSDMKLVLYQYVVSWTIHEGTLFEDPAANAWNDFTLVTPHITGAGEVIRVAACGAGVWSAPYGTADTGGLYVPDADYANFLTAVPTYAEDSTWAFRVWVE